MKWGFYVPEKEKFIREEDILIILRGGIKEGRDSLVIF